MRPTPAFKARNIHPISDIQTIIYKGTGTVYSTPDTVYLASHIYDMNIKADHNPHIAIEKRMDQRILLCIESSSSDSYKKMLKGIIKLVKTNITM